MEMEEESPVTGSDAAGPVVEGDPAAHHDEMMHDEGNQPHFVNALDVDSNQDGDSAIGIDFSSSTQSLRSSVYDYVEENGRRYHRYKEGKYFLPNDEVEQDRLDLQHQLFMMTFDGKLHLAPLDTLKGGLHNVLDIATGTGIWAIEFANAYPAASVIGTDLSPIQPDFIPPNLRFLVDDAEDPWEFSQKFDFIHGRMLVSCFKSHHEVFRSAFESLKPGGWIELQDTDVFACVDDSDKGTAFERWRDLCLEAVKKMGGAFDRTPKYASYLEEVGCTNITVHHYAWPIGTWARGAHMKTLGAWAKEDFILGMEGWSLALLTRGMGMANDEVQAMLADLSREVEGGALHAYMPILVTYGQKPEV